MNFDDINAKEEGSEVKKARKGANTGVAHAHNHISFSCSCHPEICKVTTGNHRVGDGLLPLHKISGRVTIRLSWAQRLA